VFSLCVDDHGQYFTISVNYGGCFLGSGINRSYLGGVIDWYDFCESDKWNLRALGRVLEDTGIAMSEVSRVLWCLPGQSVKNFGLADITNDDDCSNMTAAVAVGNKLLSIYVDHDDSMRGYVNDDVFPFPSQEQSGVVSPNEKFVRKPREKRQLNFDTDFEFDSDGSDFEEEIVDSDYMIYMKGMMTFMMIALKKLKIGKEREW
jgi:hypothetical protein